MADETVSVALPGEATPASPVPAESPARYERSVELGRGGMGRVVAATDRPLQRDVAIKELLDTRSDAAAVRFVREARVMAMLEHPGIVPIYELGRRADGTLYYAMRRVRGRTFAEVLASGPDERERQRLFDAFVAVCQAVAYAHRRGVTHRDLKPANLMVGEAGEALVLDWGLARADDEAPDGTLAGEEISGELTVAGAVLGTPAYMSPEQARGERVDARSDCWALGIVLYELVEGRRAFVGLGDTIVAQLRVLAEPPPVERAPPELAAVLRRALDPDRTRRYADASALVDDLLAWRHHARVSAFSYTLGSELRRIGRRYRRELALGAVVLLGVALVLGTAAARVVRERDRAERAEGELQGALARALEDRAWEHLLDEDPAGAALVAVEGLRGVDGPRLRGIAVAALGRPTPRFLWSAAVPGSAVSASWSTDGEHLLLTWAQRAQVWRGDRLVLERQTTEGLLYGAQLSADGDAVWLARDDGALERVSLRAPGTQVFDTPDAPIQGDSSARRIVAVHEDGGGVYLGREDRTVDLLAGGTATVLPWRTDTRRRGWAGAGPGRVWLAEPDEGPALRTLADGALLARVDFSPVHQLARVGPWWAAIGRRSSGNALVAVFDDEARLARTAPGLPGGHDGVAAFPEEEAIWLAGGSEALRAVTVPGLEPGPAVRHGGVGATAIAYHPARRRLATVTTEGRLVVWDVPPNLVAHGRGGPPIEGLAVRGSAVHTLAAGGALRRWEAGRSTPLPGTLTETGELYALPDGGLLTSDRDDLLWLDADGVTRARTPGLGQIFTAVVDSAAGHVIVGGGHQEVAMLDLDTRAVRWVSGHLGTDVLDVHVSGDRVGVLNVEGELRWLSAVDGAPLETVHLGERLQEAATAPDGRHFAVGTLLDPRLRLYDADAALLAEVPLTDGATDVLWGTDGRLYTTTFDGTVHVHEADTLALVAVVPFERGQLRALAEVDGGVVAAGASGRLHALRREWLDAGADTFAREAERRFGLRFVGGALRPAEATPASASAR